MRLHPCHPFYQFYVDAEGRISCSVYMRSVDCFLGMPFNIASYAILLTMVGQLTEYKPYELVFSFADTHIYNSHIEQVKLQIARDPKPLPRFMVSPGITSIDDFTFGDFILLDYEHHPAIKGEVAV